MAEEITKAYESGIQKATKTYVESVVSSMRTNGVVLDDFQKNCMIQGLTKIDEIIKAQAWKSDAKVKDIKDISPSSITATLTQVATFRLSPTAIPAECYIALKGNELQFAPQGEGYRRLVEHYGRDVKRIYEPWLIRENDDFVYPHYKGIEIVPPEWTPKGSGKVVRVVYPVQMTDDSVQYLISERADTKANLVAHISNNLIKKEEAKTKEEVLNACENLSVDEILANSEICLKGRVSPAWRHQNKEAMIVRKMKNNALKNFPKDFGNAVLATAVEQVESREDMEEASQVVIDAQIVEKTKDDIDNSPKKELPNAKTEPVPATPNATGNSLADKVKKEDDLPF